jgi:hypothetical protein
VPCAACEGLDKYTKVGAELCSALSRLLEEGGAAMASRGRYDAIKISMRT